MAISDAKRKADAKWAKKAYEQIKIQSRREKRLNDLIKYAAQRRNISASAYIVMAIEQLLNYDNITIESLDQIEQPNETISNEIEKD